MEILRLKRRSSCPPLYPSVHLSISLCTFFYHFIPVLFLFSNRCSCVTVGLEDIWGACEIWTMLSTKTIWIHMRINRALKNLPHTQCWLQSLRTNTEYSNRRPPEIGLSYPGVGYNWYERNILEGTLQWNFPVFVLFSIAKIWTFDLATGVLWKLVLVTRGVISHMLSTKTMWIHIRINTAFETSHTHSPGLHHLERTLNTPTGILRKLVRVIRGVGYNCYNRNILEHILEWNFIVLVFLYH